MLEMDNSQIEEAWMRRDELTDTVKNAGFPVVSMDLEGLKRGKMDRFLEVKDHDPD
jgi:PP-loop superfamily ATP-utilizing enzyme